MKVPVFSIASLVKLTFSKVLFKGVRSCLIKYDLFKELQSMNVVFAAFVLFFIIFFYLRPYASDGAMRTDDDFFYLRK